MSCKKLNVTVNSVFTPETQSKIYETYRILDKIGVKKWGFSSDFLQDKSYYDLPLITREISKILDDSPTMYIKNFSNGKDEVKWSKEILRSVSQVSITPFGAYHPTNFIYTGKSDPSFFNFDFGNVYKGFNQEHFD